MMMTICNQVIANTSAHKESLNHARYTTPRTFGYGAQMMEIDQHKDQFQQMMSPFYGAHAKMQNRHLADVQDKNQGSPLGDDEPADHCVILVEKQQPDSTTKPDSSPKDTTAAAPMTISVRTEQVIEDQPIPRVLQSFYWWVSGMMMYVSEKTQVCAINAARSTFCDVLSEEMANTAVPPGFEEGYAQPVMTSMALESKDTHVVQFLDESGGGGDSWLWPVEKGMGQQATHLRNLVDQDHNTLVFVAIKRT